MLWKVKGRRMRLEDKLHWIKRKIANNTKIKLNKIKKPLPKSNFRRKMSRKECVNNTKKKCKKTEPDRKHRNERINAECKNGKLSNKQSISK